MITQLEHLEIFRTLLLGAAAEGLERLYPEWVASVRAAPKTGEELKRLMEAGAPPRSEQRFARYRKLLTSTLDLSIALHQLDIPLRMLAAPSAPETFAAWHVTEQMWEAYHQRMWAHSLYAVYERVEKVISRAVRRLGQSQGNQAQKTLIKRIYAPIHELSVSHGAIRHPHAHGGGPVEGPEERGYWEVLCALDMWPATAYVMDGEGMLTPAHRLQIARHQREESLRRIDYAFFELNNAIDWQTVNSTFH